MFSVVRGFEQVRLRVLGCSDYLEHGAPKRATNDIFERVKKRLVDEGVDINEMEKNFVNVQHVGAAHYIM